jgi:hypothetical protein
MSTISHDYQNVCDLKIAESLSLKFRTIGEKSLACSVAESSGSGARRPISMNDWKAFPNAETTIMVDYREPVVGRIRTMLIEALGRFTETDAIGAWRDDDGQIIYDNSKVFTVAGLLIEDLLRIADYVLRHQEAVYVRRPDGSAGLFACRDQAGEKTA